MWRIPNRGEVKFENSAAFHKQNLGAKMPRSRIPRRAYFYLLGDEYFEIIGAILIY
jgi:hypothetical protein